MHVKHRYLVAALLLPLTLSACDWGSTRLQPPDPDDLGPRVAHAPPADRLARHRLANGIRVLLLPEVDLDLPASQFVHATLRLDIGSNADPQGMAGLAHKTALAVWAGFPSSDRSIEYHVVVGEEWTDFSFKAPQQSLGTALSYLHFGLAEAEFHSDHMQLAEAALAANVDTEPSLLQTALQASAQSQIVDAAIPTTAVRRFYAEHYGSRNALLAITAQRGSAWLDVVEQTLGQWPSQPGLSATDLAGSSQPWQQGVWLQGESDQAAWLAFAPAPRWDHPDVAALMVGQRLLQSEQWTVQWRPGYSRPGWFLAAPHTLEEPNAERWQGLKSYLQSADATLAQTVEADLQRAMEQASGTLQAGDGSATQRLRQALLLEFHGYPRNFVDLMQWQISKLKIDDVRAAVRRHLRPQLLSYYGQSPSALEVQNFQGFGDAHQARPAAVIEDAVEEEDEGISTLVETIDSESLAAQLLNAHGGVQAWQALDVITVQLRRTSQSGKPPSRAELILSWGDQLRYQSLAASGNAVVLNGEEGWLSTASSSRYLSQSELRDWHDLRQVLLTSILMEIARGSAVIHDRIADGNTVAVLLESGRSLEVVVNASGRISELRAPHWRVEYPQYQQSGGLWLPKELRFYSSLESKSRFELWELEQWHINPPRKADWFEPPQG